MELRQLYYFLEVAKQKNFSKAARALYITQPTISQQVGVLENELDVKLFDRTPQGIELTEDGRKFQKYSLKIVEALDDLMEAFGQNKSEGKAILNIGMFPFYKIVGLVPVINRFFQTNANVLGSIQILENYHCYEMLKNDQLDFAVLKARETDIPPYIAYRKLIDEPLCVILSKRNPYAGRKELHMEELADLPLLTGDVNSSFYDYTKGLYDANGTKFNVTLLTTDANMLLAMVAADEGIILASESVGHYGGPDITAVPVMPEETLSTVVAYKKGKKLKGTESAFVDCFSDYYENDFLLFLTDEK